jgi:hypothetical protein
VEGVPDSDVMPVPPAKKCGTRKCGTGFQPVDREKYDTIRSCEIPISHAPRRVSPPAKPTAPPATASSAPLTPAPPSQPTPVPHPEAPIKAISQNNKATTQSPELPTPPNSTKYSAKTGYENSPQHRQAKIGAKMTETDQNQTPNTPFPRPQDQSSNKNRPPKPPSHQSIDTVSQPHPAPRMIRHGSAAESAEQSQPRLPRRVPPRRELPIQPRGAHPGPAVGLASVVPWSATRPGMISHCTTQRRAA